MNWGKLSKLFLERLIFNTSITLSTHFTSFSTSLTFAVVLLLTFKNLNAKPTVTLTLRDASLVVR